MNTLIAVLEKALPVFAMLLLGVLCRRKNILSREGVNNMKTFAVMQRFCFTVKCSEVKLHSTSLQTT